MALPMHERVSLERGGWVVQTKDGPIQFGIPPETIKDHIRKERPVPLHFVIPERMFDPKTGVNCAEFEFPCYHAFFIKRCKATLICTPSIERRCRAVFQETLSGPTDEQLAEFESEFSASFPRASIPNMRRELDFFAGSLTTDALINFVHFDASGEARMGDHVAVRRAGDEYVVVEDGVDVARVPAALELPPVPSASVDGSFEAPRFGVTVLGNSHGFDANGACTGMAIWIEGRAILVDPPMFSRSLVPHSLVDGIMITHAHGDHDSGALQIILEERKIFLLTTPTVLGSFLRKYSALTGLDTDDLRGLFRFQPAIIGQPFLWRGAELHFNYSLHSIPCVGLVVYYGGKSMVYPSDTCTSRDKVMEMDAAGVFAGREGRREHLLHFPWHHSLILHEAGVPPIHTPMATFLELDDEIKARLHLVHVSEGVVPEGVGLRRAKTGLENTLELAIQSPQDSEAIEVLGLFAGMEMFAPLPLQRASELLQYAEVCVYHAGDVMIEEGQPGTHFYALLSGSVHVHAAVVDKTYTAGDFFGETSLLANRPTSATCVAHTECKAVRMERYRFLHWLRGTVIPQRLLHLAEVRASNSWQVMRANSLLGELSAAQLTGLQMIMEERRVAAGTVLWEAGAPIDVGAVLVDSGEFALAGEGPVGTVRAAACALVCEASLASTGRPATGTPPSRHTSTLTAGSDAHVFTLGAGALRMWFADNPGLRLQLAHVRGAAVFGRSEERGE